MAEGEVAAGVGDVEGDLVAEGVGWRGSGFGAQAAQEGEAERGVFGKVDRGWKLSRWDSTAKESAPKVGRLPTLVTASKISARACADGRVVM